MTDELAALGARLMTEVLADFEGHPPVAQPEEGITYAAKIAKEETRLDFAQDAAAVERQIRAFNPPGAWFEANGERVRVLAASIEGVTGAPGAVLDDQLTIACAGGAVRPTLVQRAGRGVMPAQELLRGFTVTPGTIL